jgi:UDP-glucose 4-epimerase
VHCAADIDIARSVTDPLPFYENNVSNTISLLRAMIAHGVRYCIFSSSCAVYGIPLYSPLDTAHATNPINPYGKTKLIIEELLRSCEQAYGLKYVALRYFNAAGALPEENLGELHEPETHLIPLLIAAAYTKQPFPLFGTQYKTKDGSAIRDYIHVRDIAWAHVLALKHIVSGNPSDIFNIGSGHGFSVKEIVDTVQTVLRMPIKVHQQAARNGDAAELIADASRAQTILQWKPQYSELSYIIKSAALFYERQRDIKCFK